MQTLILISIVVLVAVLLLDIHEMRVSRLTRDAALLRFALMRNDANETLARMRETEETGKKLFPLIEQLAGALRDMEEKLAIIRPDLASRKETRT